MSMDATQTFNDERRRRIESYPAQEELLSRAKSFLEASITAQYSYNFSWLGRPIIQYPQDMLAMQEIIWDVKPDLIIETGIAHGGSLIFYASLLALLEITGQVQGGHVLGIDIDIRDHNRRAIETHPLYPRITMFEGSSIDEQICRQVYTFAQNYHHILVCLDSNHTHAHVSAELKAYAPLVSVGSYCVVFDTVIEDMPDNSFPDRPWSKGNNPKTAVWEFLKTTDRFAIDRTIEDKLLITVAPDGYLKCIKE
jgi:cephalosporin hydroxylase